MAKINILNYELLSSQGDLKQTLKCIQNEIISISSKEIDAVQERVKIPYYSFQNEIKQNQASIYEAVKSLVLKIIAPLDENQRLSTVLIIGTSLVDWYLVDAINNTIYEDEKTPYYSQKHSIDSYAKMLAEECGLNDFTMTINTACTSSANALLEASNMLELGLFKYAVVVGVEIFSPIMSSGFYAMDLIAASKPKPFDIKRDGLVLGESLSGVLLGKEPSLWSLNGGFSNCNSQTITSVSSSGEECISVMQKALEKCQIDASDITVLKTHATGSHSNDLAEMNAICKVFDSSVVFTALKPYIGHTIGASGVSEIVLLMGSVDSGFVPKTLNCDSSIVEEYTPLKEHLPCSNGIFMCNYFGFGGNNISLIIEKELK